MARLIPENPIEFPNLYPKQNISPLKEGDVPLWQD